MSMIYIAHVYSSNTMVAGTFSNYCTLIIHCCQATEITDTAILTGLQSNFIMDNCLSKLNHDYSNNCHFPAMICLGCVEASWIDLYTIQNIKSECWCCQKSPLIVANHFAALLQNCLKVLFSSEAFYLESGMIR